MAERSEAGRRVPEAPVGEAGGSRPLGGTLLDGWLGRAVFSLFRKQKGGEATRGTDSEATSAGDLGTDSEAHSATRVVQKIVLDICHKMC